jgi:nucleotide-binding universal stress UspA family protein
MASHGRRGLAGLLIGSETQRVLANAKVPVLVIPAAMAGS